MGVEHKQICFPILIFVSIMCLYAGAVTSCSSEKVYFGHGEKYDSWAWNLGREEGWSDCEQNIPMVYTNRFNSPTPSGWTFQNWSWFHSGYDFGYELASDFLNTCVYHN